MKCFISIISSNCNLSITFPDHHFGDSSNKYHSKCQFVATCFGALLQQELLYASGGEYCNSGLKKNVVRQNSEGILLGFTEIHIEVNAKSGSECCHISQRFKWKL